MQLQVPTGSIATLNASMLTDTVLGAMFIAGRSCGPPNALSSSTLAAIEEKYVESVCYYAGPIFRSITDNNTVDIPCYNSTFESDIVLVNSLVLPNMSPTTNFLQSSLLWCFCPNLSLIHPLVQRIYLICDAVTLMSYFTC